jgi:hypothetical protein
MAAKAGGIDHWARFRIWPGWRQALLWVVLTPVPVAFLAAPPMRRRWWALVTLVAVVWLGALAVVIHNAATVLDSVTSLPRPWRITGVIVAVLGFLYLILGVLPVRLVPGGGLEKAELLKARNDVRSGLLTALTLSGALFGGYLGLGQLELGRKELQYNLQASQRTQELTREGQITERFTRAVDQLGHQALDTRVGGIYALERIARDSQVDHGPIMEILTAFLREHGRSGFSVPDLEAACTETNVGADTGSGDVAPPRLRADLQAALTVLGRRTAPYDKPDWKLNLYELDLPNAYLVDASLAEAELRRTILDHANLTGANLAKADLREASLKRAELADADLREVGLEYANLYEANLRDAKLEGAELPGACLVHADLVNANLTGAFLGSAVLSNADLRDANLVGARNLAGANLKGALSNSRTRWPAGFNPREAGVVPERMGGGRPRELE